MGNNGYTLIALDLNWFHTFERYQWC